MTDNTLNTTSSVIDALGGTTKLARFCGVTMQAVSNWRAEDTFPPNRHFQIYRECERRGLAVDLALFGEVAA